MKIEVIKVHDTQELSALPRGSAVHVFHDIRNGQPPTVYRVNRLGSYHFEFTRKGRKNRRPAFKGYGVDDIHIQYTRDGEIVIDTAKSRSILYMEGSQCYDSTLPLHRRR